MRYWDGDPTENLFMEVTTRSNLGDDLLASFAIGGGASAASNLAREIKRGDIVIHYDSLDKAIVLVSRVSAPPKETDFMRTNPRSGAKTGLSYGIGVPLRSTHIEVVPPVTLDEMRRKQKSIFTIKRRLEKQFGAKGLCFPWIDYNGTLRTAVPYLNKVPKAALALFPSLEKAVKSLP